MGAFEDYINGLDGQTEIDPIAVAQQLSELHTHEIQTHEAKISELSASQAQKDADLAARDAEITRWKAKNFDLHMQIPSGGTNDRNPANDDETPTGDRITTSDLFTPRVRNRHGLR